MAGECGAVGRRANVAVGERVVGSFPRFGGLLVAFEALGGSDLGELFRKGG